jgi:hypothetical protein
MWTEEQMAPSVYAYPPGDVSGIYAERVSRRVRVSKEVI